MVQDNKESWRVSGIKTAKSVGTRVEMSWCRADDAEGEWDGSC